MSSSELVPTGAVTQSITKANAADFVNHFVDSTIETFEQMLGVHVRKDKGPDIIGVSGVIGLAGASMGAVILNFSTASAIKSVEAFVGEVYTSVTEEVVDGVGELTNVIAGSAKSKLIGIGYNYDIGLPKIVKGSAYEVEQQRNAPMCIVVSFVSALGPMSLEVTLAKQDNSSAKAKEQADQSAMINAFVDLMIGVQEAAGVMTHARIRVMQAFALRLAGRVRMANAERLSWGVAVLGLSRMGRPPMGGKHLGKLASGIPGWRELSLALQYRDKDYSSFPVETQHSELVRMAQILHLAEEIETLMHEGQSAVSAALRLKSQAGRYELALIDAACEEARSM